MTSRKLRIFVAVCVAFGSGATGASTSYAGTGALDPAFGVGGIVTGGPLDTYGPMAVDSAGRITVLGTTGARVALARFTSTGAPDTTFSGDGRVEFGPADVAYFNPIAIRVLADGSIVAAGVPVAGPGGSYIPGTLATKVSPTGDFVTSYGVGGTMFSGDEFEYHNNQAGRGSIAPDGSITVPHYAGNPTTSWLTEISSAGVYLGDGPEIANPTTCAGLSGLSALSVARPSATQEIVLVAPFCNVGAEPPTYLISRTVGSAINDWAVALPPDRSPSSVGDETDVALSMVGTDVMVPMAVRDSTTFEVTSTYLERYTVAGARVTTWGTTGSAVLPDGSGEVLDITELNGGRVGVVSAGSTTARITRLLARGVADPNFPQVDLGVGNLTVAGALDGGVLVTTGPDLRRYDGTSPPTAFSALTPLPTPGRLLDTRPGGSTVDGKFVGAGVRPAGSLTELVVGGRGGVPVDASAAVLNVTVTAAQGSGYITVFPCGQSQPNASNLNFVSGSTVPNAVIVKMGAGGKVCLFTAESGTHLLVDVNGYFPPGSGFESLVPARVLDSRPGGNTIDAKFVGAGLRPAGSITELQLAGRGGVPANAEAAVLNVTVTGAQGGGYVTVFPCGQTQPNASNLNFAAGDTVPNAVVVKVGAGGKVCLFTAESGTDLLVDVNGYFPPGAGFVSLSPTRVLDSRPTGQTADTQFARLGLRGAGSVTELLVVGRGGVPADASSVVLNVTVTGAQGAGYITVYPCGQAVPTVSSLNFVAGATVPNAVIVRVGTGGKVCLFTAEAATHLIADVNGYFPSLDGHLAGA